MRYCIFFILVGGLSSILYAAEPSKNAARHHDRGNHPGHVEHRRPAYPGHQTHPHQGRHQPSHRDRHPWPVEYPRHAPRDQVVIVPTPHLHERRGVSRHRPGHWLRVLPRIYFDLRLGAAHFYYTDGNFFRPQREGYVVVSAPLGVVVPTLPDDYTLILLNDQFYYVVDDTFYVRVENGYQVVKRPISGALPLPAVSTKLPAPPSPNKPRAWVIYPAQGQSEQQQSVDRYACHQWGTQQSGYDPSLSETGTDAEVELYYRAMGACLEARGYSIK